MISGLLIIAIILLIIGLLTPVGSGTTLLVASILFIVALVLSLKKKGSLVDK
ncbi:hypothetical protein JI667_14150 [Bacillus sp. NTK074B]|uniref:hypothetical protein n=1 Tax=Bacillus sp. NTK074B TaxID=2802174 RepID=UPI001A90816D|nr:hypothetical protein [Bacillus sp. NTK074B]